MGKSKESKTVNRQAEQEYTRFGNQSDALYKMLLEDLQNPDQTYNDILGGYKSAISASPYSSFIGAGDMADLNIDDTEKNRIRGLGVYDEFAKTGGLTDQDTENLRSRGKGAVRSLYSSLQDQYNRLNTTQGGISPGYDSRAAKLSREGSRAMDEASLNAELGITDTRNRGRMWGAEGASQSERGLQGLLSQNTGIRLGAKEADARLGLADKGQRLDALGGMGSLYGNRKGMLLNSLLQQYGIGASGRQNSLSNRMQYNPNQGFFDKYLMPLLGAGAAGAAGAASGGAYGGGTGWSEYNPGLSDDEIKYMYGGW